MDTLLGFEGSSATLYYQEELMVVTIQKIPNQSLYMITYTMFSKHYSPVFIMAIISIAMVVILTYATVRYLSRHTSMIVNSVNDLVELTGQVSTGTMVIRFIIIHTMS